MIYGEPNGREPIDQGDIIDGYPVLFLKGFDLDGGRPPQIDVSISRAFVLTRTCDLANQKAVSITLAVILDAQELIDQGVLKAADVRGSIRAGRVFGWYFLPKSEIHGLPEMIVDLRQLHTAEIEILAALCESGRRRARLLCPYREHLAKHFADTFSRIGLPEPYRTD